ncbi:MAG: dipeptidase [Candidatus Margulisiibacteriota bacterium]
MNTILNYLSQNESALLKRLFDSLKIPSVSTKPEHQPDIAKSAQHTADAMRDIGLENVAIMPTAGNPVVYGDWLNAPGKPTILFYGHYDVQPAEPLDLWETPAFEPAIRDGYIFARGVSDDKGQFLCHFNAIEAFLKTEGKLPVNVKVIIEGEEEIGSPNLVPFLKAHRELLKADVAFVSDTTMLSKGNPSICYSLRGLIYTQLEVTGANTDLHSGQHGGAVPNPINALGQIISQLKDNQNRVTVPGFYDDVVVLSAEQRAAIAALPQDDTAYKKWLGVDALVGEEGYSSFERRWFRPTLDCNGIWGGYMGDGSKTVIPSKAFAKISMRLVANQKAEALLEAFKKHIQTLTPAGVTVDIVSFTATDPGIIDPTHPAIQAGLTALEQAFDTKAVLHGDGGSIPIVTDFKTILGLETVLMGFNHPEDKIHAPNEQFGVANFFGGSRAVAHFLKLFGDA